MRRAGDQRRGGLRFRALSARTEEAHGTPYARYTLHLLRQRVTRTPALAQLDQLADGEVLDVPGSPRVLHAPGHTAGHCALSLEDQSLLFSGDALVTLDMTRGRTGALWIWRAGGAGSPGW